MSIRVVQPGALLTLQDRGRIGYRQFGVPWSGALDWWAHNAANRVIGNTTDHASLEITGAGCVLQFTSSTVIALVGGDLGAELDGKPLPTNTAWLVRAGAELRFSRRIHGARVYLAVSGGFALAPQLGSRSTLIGSNFKSPLNRALRAGDVLPVGTPDFAVAGQQLIAPPFPAMPPTIRYIRGPHEFREADYWAFQQTPWQISPTSNRMGYRLHGATLEPPTATLDSFGVLPGVIQVPPNGNPIVLLADAQTTGGYPVIGNVIHADLALFAQLLPDDMVYFVEVTLDQAEHVWQTNQDRYHLLAEEQYGAAV